MPNELAPEGKVFVCLACGKRSRDLYGTQAINKSWDESCMLNAQLFEEKSLTIINDHVYSIKEDNNVFPG